MHRGTKKDQTLVACGYVSRLGTLLSSLTGYQTVETRKKSIQRLLSMTCTGCR
jgi:hypothetical protein